MKVQARVVSWLAALCALAAGGFVYNECLDMDSGSWEPLAGAPDFYTKTDYEGWTTLGYSTHWWKQPESLHGGFYNFRLENHQVVGHDTESGVRVVVDVSARSNAEAKASLVIRDDKQQ